MASVKSNAGVASELPNATDTPPNDTVLFSSNAFVISPEVRVSCFVFNCVVVELDKSAISLLNSLDV